MEPELWFGQSMTTLLTQRRMKLALGIGAKSLSISVYFTSLEKVYKTVPNINWPTTLIGGGTHSVPKIFTIHVLYHISILQ